MRNPGKSHAIPCPSKLKELKLFVVVAGEKLLSKRLRHRLRPPASVVLDVHRGLRRQQQLGALHMAVVCCKMQRSGTSAPRRSEAPPAAAPRLLSSRAVAVPDVHGRALRQEKGDDRRVVAGCCRLQRGPATALEVDESAEAAPVAAQVAPHRRQVAVGSRPGDVGVSARGEMQQK